MTENEFKAYIDNIVATAPEAIQVSHSCYLIYMLIHSFFNDDAKLADTAMRGYA